MEQSNKSITFSDLQGLKELTKEESKPSLLSWLFGRTNKTVYQVQDNLYDTGMDKWRGGIIKINGKTFPNGKGYFYYKDGKKIKKNDELQIL